MKEKVSILTQEIISQYYFTLKKITFQMKMSNNQLQLLQREVYHNKDGVTILLYNKQQRTILLTRQFRLSTYLNKNATGFLIESCAGALDEDDPEACVMREVQEETGFEVTGLSKAFSAYMSPGNSTEILHYFIGTYSKNRKPAKGGGKSEEQEDIEVLELDFDHAFGMIGTGEIKDANTILLLQYLKLNNVF
ncbi:MAG: NUDIX domain-containing protein [Bacteroidota bacterium]